MSRLDAILFDMDGTLMDSEPCWLRADLAMIAAFGGFMTEEEHDACIGMGAVTFLPYVQEKYGITASFDEMKEFQEKTFLEIARAELKPFSEMIEFSRWAREKAIPIAIASGSTNHIIEEMTALTGIQELFPVRVSSHEVEKGKPFPDVFLEAAKRLAVKPENCLVIEDSPVGVMAAYQAGMHTVAVPPPVVQDPKGYLNKADHLYEDGMLGFSSEKMILWLKEYFSDSTF
ncbi:MULTISPECIES: HAD family phosphatase [unclassified Oceanispirochaeta]|uniref:HAD family hydrolase n=1 Tax=unclassified Oceanispirochaeta TaxID=2635722 RepID=UPI000E09B2DE|nr:MULTISPECIES: HAD family phosphatase [unclassified Oceanispirochaeta]MBF9018069.1 HAD family phosphatase [Oceanispirochaeta sp. M2]NPD73850.1 HAD family phosphatase [Oceanispirochaeta sp. M1]RDG30312.1 HAD family phosphatase [Oceanispirochaeta sp. M1]